MTRQTRMKLLPRLRHVLRVRHYSPRTEQVYLAWVRRYVEFHGRRHPNELGEAGISAFLGSLAEDGNVAAGTLNQALAALLFMYRYVLGVPISVGRDVVPAKRPRRGGGGDDAGGGLAGDRLPGRAGPDRGAPSIW